jgi:hypothetical protein
MIFLSRSSSSPPAGRATAGTGAGVGAGQDTITRMLLDHLDRHLDLLTRTRDVGRQLDVPTYCLTVRKAGQTPQGFPEPSSTARTADQVDVAHAASLSAGSVAGASTAMPVAMASSSNVGSPDCVALATKISQLKNAVMKAKADLSNAVETLRICRANHSGGQGSSNASAGANAAPQSMSPVDASSQSSVPFVLAGWTPCVVASLDPNGKFGSSGVGASRFVAGTDAAPYTVTFENLDTATAPAQIVTITDQLNTTADDLVDCLGTVDLNRSAQGPSGYRSILTGQSTSTTSSY